MKIVSYAELLEMPNGIVFGVFEGTSIEPEDGVLFVKTGVVDLDKENDYMAGYCEHDSAVTVRNFCLGDSKSFVYGDDEIRPACRIAVFTPDEVQGLVKNISDIILNYPEIPQ